MFRFKTVEQLKTFTWSMAEEELTERAPTLYNILRSVSARDSSKAKLSSVGMAAAILLRARNKKMSLVQSIISVILHAGHCSKKVLLLYFVMALDLSLCSIAKSDILQLCD